MEEVLYAVAGARFPSIAKKMSRRWFGAKEGILAVTPATPFLGEYRPRSPPRRGKNPPRIHGRVDRTICGYV